MSVLSKALSVAVVFGFIVGCSNTTINPADNSISSTSSDAEQTSSTTGGGEDPTSDGATQETSSVDDVDEQKTSQAASPNRLVSAEEAGFSIDLSDAEGTTIISLAELNAC